MAKNNVVPTQQTNKAIPLIDTANELKIQFSSDYLSKQIDIMLDMQEKNPTEAIGKAKELIIVPSSNNTISRF